MPRVKTWQPYYTIKIVGGSPELDRAGWHWHSCSLSTRLMSWSERLDRYHWEHWALEHEDCTGARRCAECGGFFEDDEDPAKIEAAFDGAEKRVTREPGVTDQ